MFTGTQETQLIKKIKIILIQAASNFVQFQFAPVKVKHLSQSEPKHRVVVQASCLLEHIIQKFQGCTYVHFTSSVRKFLDLYNQIVSLWQMFKQPPLPLLIQVNLRILNWSLAHVPEVPFSKGLFNGFALTVTPAHQRAHLLDCSETTHNQSVYTYTCRA